MLLIVRIAAGAIVWAVHFVAIYGLTALACARAFPAAVPWAIGIASTLAAAALLAIIVSAPRAPDFARWMTMALAGLASIAIVWETIAVFTVPACAPVPIVEGNAENGQLLLRQYGCGACHRIPGVAAADGSVGPPLAGIARRVYIAGVLPNTPQNMARWIQHPQRFEPRTAMPDLQVSPAQARDMVAYLYRQR
jgi:cytochrome c2